MINYFGDYVPTDYKKLLEACPAMEGHQAKEAETRAAEEAEYKTRGPERQAAFERSTAAYQAEQRSRREVEKLALDAQPYLKRTAEQGAADGALLEEKFRQLAKPDVGQVALDHDELRALLDSKSNGTAARLEAFQNLERACKLPKP